MFLYTCIRLLNAPANLAAVEWAHVVTRAIARMGNDTSIFYRGLLLLSFYHLGCSTMVMNPYYNLAHNVGGGANDITEIVRTPISAFKDWVKYKVSGPSSSTPDNIIYIGIVGVLLQLGTMFGLGSWLKQWWYDDNQVRHSLHTCHVVQLAVVSLLMFFFLLSHVG